MPDNADPVDHEAEIPGVDGTQSQNERSFVRATHPYAYKSGEWGQIVGDVTRQGRLCWLIVWPDGRTDEWVADDPNAGYEFAEGVG